METPFRASSRAVVCLALAIAVAACNRAHESARAREIVRTATATAENAAHTAERAVQAQEAERAIDEAMARAREEAQRDLAMTLPTLSFSDALDDIAATRCDRESRCGNVGGGKRYETVLTCRSEVRADLVRVFHAIDCPTGVDRREFVECEQAVRDVACAASSDLVTHLSACRTTTICHTAPALTMR